MFYLTSYYYLIGKTTCGSSQFHNVDFNVIDTLEKIYHDTRRYKCRKSSGYELINTIMLLCYINVAIHNTWKNIP